MTRLVLLIGLVLTLVGQPAPASAQEVRWLYAPYAAAQAGDYWTTERALASGHAEEANPLMSACAPSKVCLGTVKTGITAAWIWAMESVRKTHPKLAFWTGLAETGLAGFVVVHNYRASQ